MNHWKPIALLSIAGLVSSVGAQVAAAGVCHDQPNMANAAASLKAARASLDKAEHDKGGWRDCCHRGDQQGHRRDRPRLRLRRHALSA